MKSCRHACENWQGSDDFLSRAPSRARPCVVLGVLRRHPRALVRVRRAQSPVAYTISLASPEQHLVDVQIFLPEGAAQRELQLPVWNALYQIRDFAQYVNWVRAKDRSGNPLPLRELNMSRWQLQGAEHGAIVEYQIYARLAGPLQRATQSASCLLQSGADSHVSRRRALRAAATALQPSSRRMAHCHSSSHNVRRRIYRRELRSPGRLSGRDRQLSGVRFRRSRRPLPRHRRRRLRRLRHGKDRCRAAQDCRRRDQLDERPSLRHLHVHLSLPARPGGRRHGARLLDGHRSECRRDEAVAGRSDRRHRARILSSLERQAHPPADSRTGGLHQRKLHARAVVQRRRHQHRRRHHSVARRPAR